MSGQDRIRFAVLGVFLGGCAAAFGQGGTGAAKPSPSTMPSPPAAEPAATRPVEGPSPRLEVSPGEFDFGEVWQGAPARREFTVRNVGTAPLTLRAKSSCGCTVATKPKTPLAPGESSTFSISYDTKRAGKAHKKVTLKTNDPTRPAVEIHVRGTVKRVYTATPNDRIVFLGLRTDSIESQTIKLENNFGSPLTLKLKEGQDVGPFEVALKEIEPGMEYELTATTKPPLKDGGSRATVTLELESEKLPPISIRLLANVQPPVVVIPRRLLLTPSATQPTQRRVRVQYRTDQPIKITDVRASLDSIKYEILPSVPHRAGRRTGEHQIRVTLPVFEDIPEQGARLEIYTDDKSAEYQKLVVPIMRRDIPIRRHPLTPRPVKKRPAK